MSAWATFWLFLAVFYICETVLMLRGITGFIYDFKTDAEREIQRGIVDRLRAKDAP